MPIFRIILQFVFLPVLAFSVPYFNWYITSLNVPIEKKLPIDHLVLIVIGLGIWVGLIAPLFSRVGQMHESQLTGQAHTKYFSMNFWLFVFIFLSFLIIPVSLTQPVRSSLSFIAYLAFTAYCLILIYTRCIQFQVPESMCVINPKGLVLMPGLNYHITPFSVSQYAPIPDRCQIPQQVISVRTNDTMNRELRIAPILTVHIDQIEAFEPGEFSLSVFLQRAFERIRETLLIRASSLSLLELMEHRSSPVEFTVEGIPFTWEGDGHFHYIVNHCHCNQSDCPICHPKQVTAFYVH